MKYNPSTWVTRALNQRVDELERENKLLHRRLERQATIATELRERNSTINRKLQTYRMRAYTARQRAELWKHRALRKDAA